MAHKSRKKHIKHIHAHEPATPAARHPGAKADVETERGSKSRAVKLTGAAKAVAAKAKAKAGARSTSKKNGLVSKIARAAGKKLAAKPKKIISRVKSRVSSLVGRSSKQAA